MARAEIRCIAAGLRDDPDEDSRVLTVSHLMAGCLALVWLALVYFGPHPVEVKQPEVTITVPPPVAEFFPSPPREFTRRGSAPMPRSDATRARGSVRDAFVGVPGAERRDFVSGVRIMPSAPTSDPLVRAVPLGTSGAVETPGRSRLGSEGLRGGELGVVAPGGVSRAGIAIMPPEIRAVSEGARGDATEVGRSAREHAPQLQRCYVDEGLTKNPGLAGLVRLEIDVQKGRVVSARVVDRSWTGAGVAEAESCLVRAVRGWRLGTSSGVVTLPVSFTSGTPGR